MLDVGGVVSSVVDVDEVGATVLAFVVVISVVDVVVVATVEVDVGVVEVDMDVA